MSLGSSATPRKSAVAIVLARSANGEARVLVGKRSLRSRFLGGFYAFPGGVIESEDGDVEADEDASLRRTASRELAEETGIEVAPEAFLDSGRRVTPPFALRRFDSLMYLAELSGEWPVKSSGELEELAWASPGDLYTRWRNLEIRVAPPLIPILEVMASTEREPAEEIAARLRSINSEMEADGPRIEFVPDVLMIPLATPTLPPATHTNCYLVGSKEFVIVDPGSGDPAEVARLARHVRRRMEGGRTPTRIFLTHHHGDHVGGAIPLAREFSIPLCAHAQTWELWSDGALVRRNGEAHEVHDDETIALSGGEALRVLHTPGHAKGHVAIFEETAGSLLAGDLVSGVSTILVGGESGDLDRYLSSLERIRDLGAKTLFPAHGPPMISPSRAVQRVLEHRSEREGRIVEALRDGAKAVDDIARLAYADTPGAAHGLAVRQVMCHLDRLDRLGRVRREGDAWRLSS